MARPPTEHDNFRVQRFLGCYYHAAAMCNHHPEINDILSGALALKTEGKSSTRTLSRSTLFHVLQQCPSITVRAIDAATHGRYCYSTLAEYAAMTRVVSKAIEGYLRTRPGQPEKSVRQSQRELDAPYMAELEALGLI